MYQAEEDQLQEFLAKFNVTELGMGDPIAGINTLTAMCSVLAGVARPGSGILAENGRLVRIGTSLLVSGSVSAGLVADEVLAELALRQNSFTEHLRHDLEWKERMSKKKLKTWVPPEPEMSNSEHTMFSLQSRGGLNFGKPEENWAQVLASPPNETVEHISLKPKFFVTAARPKDLERRLTGLLRGRSLVHLSVTRPSDLVAFGETAGGLLDGCYSVGTHGETVGGNLLITDPMQMLGEAAKSSDEGTAWLGRTIWLCDEGTGPAMPAGLAAKNLAVPLTKRFQLALGLGLGKRLCGEKMAPVQIKADFLQVQQRWTAFLKGMEKSLPGISGAARNLPATLLFGLCELSTCVKGQPIQLVAGDVEVFARFLVHRMAAARAAILYAAAVVRRQRQIERVFRKLNAQPVNERTIYKNLNIKSKECKGCLNWLDTMGLARRAESGWERAEGAQLSFTVQALPVLEVLSMPPTP